MPCVMQWIGLRIKHGMKFMLHDLLSFPVSNESQINKRIYFEHFEIHGLTAIEAESKEYDP